MTEFAIAAIAVVIR